MADPLKIQTAPSVVATPSPAAPSAAAAPPKPLPRANAADVQFPQLAKLGFGLIRVPTNPTLPSAAKSPAAPVARKLAAPAPVVVNDKGKDGGSAAGAALAVLAVVGIIIGTGYAISHGAGKRD